MTALSPGPWTHERGADRIRDANGRNIGRAWESDSDGRAMASAREALAVLEELAVPEHELLRAFQEATGIDARDLTRGPPESVRAFHHWVWLRNDVLRNKAEKVLKKAGVKP